MTQSAGAATGRHSSKLPWCTLWSTRDVHGMAKSILPARTNLLPVMDRVSPTQLPDYNSNGQEQVESEMLARRHLLASKLKACDLPPPQEPKDQTLARRVPLQSGVPRHWGSVRCGCIEGVLGTAILAGQHADVWDAAAMLLRDHHRWAFLLSGVIFHASCRQVIWQNSMHNAGMQEGAVVL